MTKFQSLISNIDRLMVLTVIVPTCISALYFGLLASDIYVSESRFVVRSPEKPAASGLGSILKSAGFANAGDEIEAAKDFIKSRDALAAINSNGQIARAYGGASVSIFDRYNPLGWNGSFEDLHDYFSRKVTIEQDTATSITTLTIRAFTPQDAARINRQLLEQSEGLVNRLNVRGRKDLIGYAETEFVDAQREAKATGLRLAEYRNRTGVVDPERQAAVQLQMISKLQDELIGARNQLAQLEATVPDNPQIRTTRARIAALTREIDQETGKVAGDRLSLSATAARYEGLVLDQEIASKRLAAAVASLQDARSEARRKQAYVERIVEPNTPDEAVEPRRSRGIIATFVLGLIAWGVLSILLAGMREHQD